MRLLETVRALGTVGYFGNSAFFLEIVRLLETVRLPWDSAPNGNNVVIGDSVLNEVST